MKKKLNEVSTDARFRIPGEDQVWVIVHKSDQRNEYLVKKADMMYSKYRDEWVPADTEVEVEVEEYPGYKSHMADKRSIDERVVKRTIDSDPEEYEEGHITDELAKSDRDVEKWLREHRSAPEQRIKELEALLMHVYKNAKTVQQICDIAIERAHKNQDMGQGSLIPANQVAEVVEMIKKDIQVGIIDKIPVTVVREGKIDTDGGKQ